MASNSFSVIFFFGLVVLTSNLFARTNGASVVENVCQQTKSKPLCLTYFATDARSKTASLKQLAQIAIDTVEFDSIAVKTKIHSFVISEKNPNLKSLYFRCENFYLDALNALATAGDDLAQSRYVDLKKKAQIAINGGVGCEAAFNNRSQFKSGNQELEILGQAIAIMANQL